jgi:hypothetical protein
VLHQLTAAGTVIDPRQNTRERSGINNPISSRQIFEVTGETNIPVDDSDPIGREAPISLATGPAQVIDPEDVGVRKRLQDPPCDRAPNKPADAGYEDLHRKAQD